MDFDRRPMARNIEIKAHVESIEALARKAAAIADEGPIEIIQDDIFFRCDSGGLKLRAFSSEEGELIFYRRATNAARKSPSTCVRQRLLPIRCASLWLRLTARWVGFRSIEHSFSSEEHGSTWTTSKAWGTFSNLRSFSTKVNSRRRVSAKLRVLWLALELNRRSWSKGHTLISLLNEASSSVLLPTVHVGVCLYL